MHFWIDKRSNYGIGQNRSMTGMNYQNRRIRSKSLTTPMRPHPPPCIPSTSHHHHHSKTTQHRARHHTTAPDNPAAAAIPSTSAGLNSQHVPVIHSVYPQNDLPVVPDSSDNTRGSISLRRCFLIYLKCVLSLSILMILLTVKFYSDNNQMGLFWLLITFGVISLMLLTFPIFFSNKLCERKNRSTINMQTQNEVVTGPLVNNQVIAPPIEISEPPPPYAVAIKISEKPHIHYESPPPSYEKINII